MNQFLYTAARWCLYFLFSLIILAAITVGAGRQFLSQIDNMRFEAQTLLSEQTGLYIDFDHIGGDWEKLSPFIQLKNLSVRESAKSEPILRARSVYVQWHMGSSILSFKPSLIVRVEGAQAGVTYTEGKIKLLGLSDTAADAEPFDWKLLDKWIHQPLLELKDSQVIVKDVWPHEARLTDISVKLYRRAFDQRLKGTLVLAPATPSVINSQSFDFGDISQNMEMSLDAAVSGQLNNLNSLSGRLYAKLSAPDLAYWVPSELNQSTTFELENAAGELELWARVSSGVAQRVTGKLQLSTIALNHPEKKNIPQMESLTGIVQWQRVPDGWHLATQDIELHSPGIVWAPQQFSLACAKSSTGFTYDAYLDYLEIKPWADYGVVFTDAESGIHKLLSAIQIEGHVKDIHAHWTQQADQITEYELSGKLQEVRNQPYGFIPGLSRLDALFRATEKEVLISLINHPLDVEYPRIFRNKMHVDFIKGDVRILNQEDEWLLQSGLLSLSNPDIRGSTQISVSVPKDSSISPYLRLQATLRDVDAKNTAFYLPAGVLSDGLVDWLDKSVLGGNLLLGDLLFHGPVDLENEPEHLQVVLGFTVDDATVQFLPDWKPITEGAADIRVYSGAVEADIVTAKYYGTTLTSGSVDRPYSAQYPSNPLDINVRTQGPLSEAFSILTDSPLRERVGDVVDDFAVSGHGDIAVKLGIPLGAEDAVNANQLSAVVDTQISNGKFKLKSNDLMLSELKGHVGFDLSVGLFSEAIQGQLFGDAFTATIQPYVLAADKRKLPATYIAAAGKGKLGPIKQWLKNPLLVPMSGSLRYDAALILPATVPGEKKSTLNSKLVIKSNLKNVAVALPAPFGKLPSEQTPLVVSTSLGAPNSAFNLTYRNMLDVRLLSDDGRLIMGNIALGANSAVLPKTKHLSVRGKLPEFSVDGWIDVLDQIQVASAQWPSLVGDPSSLVRLIDQSDLYIENLIHNEKSIGAMQIIVGQTEKAWLVEAAGEKVIANVELPFALYGKESYTADDPVLSIHVNHLELEKSVAELDKQFSIKKSLDPRKLPPVDFKMDALVYGGEPFGTWRAAVRPMENGVSIEEVEFELKHVSFKGRGAWLEENDGPYTQISGVGSAGNVYDVIKAWGYEPTLDSQKAKLTLLADWRGAPYDFDLMDAHAEAEFEVENGKFFSISSGAADKVLGVLNFDRWLDRMRLEFEDLRSNEMTYSVIEGQFKLENHMLSLKALNLESPAARLALDGELDLQEKTLNTDLEVTVPVTRNLVLPAAAVGGLPAAATVFVIQKVLGAQLDKLTTMKYKMTGPFSDPEVTLKDTFNIIPKQLQETLTTDKSKAKPELPTDNVGDVDADGVNTGDIADESVSSISAEAVSNDEDLEAETNLKLAPAQELESNSNALGRPHDQSREVQEKVAAP